MKDDFIVKMEKICKSFSGVAVLDNVEFSLRKGEIRALVGENGAGKSTLMKILCGIYEKDSGDIVINDTKISDYSINEAAVQGIAMIHQEIVLVQDLSVAENIYMGREPRTRVGTVDFRKMNSETAEILKAFNLESISPNTTVNKLSISQQQMIEIARALAKNAKVIIMDEPTSSLTDREVEILFAQIKRLKKAGVSVIYISHKMDEIFQIADSITVMRDGCHIISSEIHELTYDQIIKYMVGREITEYYPPHNEKAGDEILRLENVTTDKVDNINFTLHKGEILGLAGLVGAGRTELADAVFGITPVESGKILFNGKPFAPKTPRDAVKRGIALVPEDRKKNGLFLENAISYNMTIAVLDKFIRFIFPNKQKENEIIDHYIHMLSIKMAGKDQLTVELSGGNQQKVVFSKWMAVEPQILILDEPTRGIDVGAKAEIYHLIHKIAEAGVGIILISSELPEVLNLSTRIGVMCEGKLVKIFDLQQGICSQEEVMHYATGGYKNG